MSKNPATAGARLMRLLSAAAEGVRRLSRRRGRGRTIDPLEDGRIPLDLAFIVPARPDFLARCRALAEKLVARDGGRRATPWDDGAVLVLTAFIAFVVACETEAGLRNLTTVKRLISSPEAYDRAVRAMQRVRGFGGGIALQGEILRWLDGPELGAVMAVALRRTAWLDDPAAPAGPAGPGGWGPVERAFYPSAGDVIVDPQGRSYRIEETGLKEIPSLAPLIFGV